MLISNGLPFVEVKTARNDFEKTIFAGDLQNLTGSEPSVTSLTLEITDKSTDAAVMKALTGSTEKAEKQEKSLVFAVDVSGVSAENGFITTSIHLPDTLKNSEQLYLYQLADNGKAEVAFERIGDDIYVKTAVGSVYGLFTEKLGDSQTPTTPEKPDQPEKPAEPENPEKPAEPEQPGKSSGSSSIGGAGKSSGSSVSAHASSTSAGKWVQDQKGWWYQFANGTWPKSSWQYLAWNGSSDWYYFDENGYVVSGWFADSSGNKYYLHNLHDGNFGKMYTGMHVIDGKQEYFNTVSDAGILGAWKNN